MPGPAVAVLDLQLPDGDGISLGIKRRWPLRVEPPSIRRRRCRGGWSRLVHPDGRYDATGHVPTASARYSVRILRTGLRLPGRRAARRLRSRAWLRAITINQPRKPCSSPSKVFNARSPSARSRRRYLRRHPRTAPSGIESTSGDSSATTAQKPAAHPRKPRPRRPQNGGPQGVFAKVPGLGAAYRGLTAVLPLRRGQVLERQDIFPNHRTDRRCHGSVIPLARISVPEVRPNPPSVAYPGMAR
jgi:hypothetical protein